MPHGDQKLTHLAEKDPHGHQKLTRFGNTAFSHVLVATTRVRYVLEARTHVCGAYVYVYISVLDQARGAAGATKDNVQHMTRMHADVFMLAHHQPSCVVVVVVDSHWRLSRRGSFSLRWQTSTVCFAIHN